FHSLRHQYVSNLAAAGVHPKIAQTLARHSTIGLTMERYTHVELHDLMASVNSLPSIQLTEENAVALSPTGTEGPDSEVPVLVPGGAKNGAILPASPALQIAPVCTESGKLAESTDAVTLESAKAIRTALHESAPSCIDGSEKGPSRIRTGDGGFAIRCLSRLA